MRKRRRQSEREREREEERENQRKEERERERDSVSEGRRAEVLRVSNRFSSSRWGPVDLSFRALSGRLEFTVRRYSFDKD